MFTWQAEITGDDKAVKGLDAIIKAMRDMSPLFESVIEPAFYEWQTERFDTEGGDQRWQRLSSRYAAWKAQHFPGKKILDREGLLREGLTRRGGRFQVRRLDGTLLELGSRHPAAEFHQHGTSRMPKREIITITGSHVGKWQKLVEDYYAKVAREAVG